MTDQVGADFGRLAGTHQHLVSTVSQMNSQLQSLKDYLKPLVATWEGEAAANYQALQHKWDTAAADLNSVLQRIGAALGDTNAEFQATEKSNAARF